MTQLCLIVPGRARDVHIHTHIINIIIKTDRKSLIKRRAVWVSFLCVYVVCCFVVAFVCVWVLDALLRPSKCTVHVFFVLLMTQRHFTPNPLDVRNAECVLAASLCCQHVVSIACSHTHRRRPHVRATQHLSVTDLAHAIITQFFSLGCIKLSEIPGTSVYNTS